MMAFNIPAYPSPVRALLQAVVAYADRRSARDRHADAMGSRSGGPVLRAPTAVTDWAAPTGAAAALFDAEWINLFPMGMDIGIFNPANGIVLPNGHPLDA